MRGVGTVSMGMWTERHGYQHILSPNATFCGCVELGRRWNDGALYWELRPKAQGPRRQDVMDCPHSSSPTRIRVVILRYKSQIGGLELLRIRLCRYVIYEVLPGAGAADRGPEFGVAVDWLFTWVWIERY
ncbi:hypothetical protein BDZ91DRAFT_745582 [Kalaharituber pfeilii]|nr:hypothetical protein BDZ91DRAFT_745582 [Kalaharituber pfeilii]